MCVLAPRARPKLLSLSFKGRGPTHARGARVKKGEVCVAPAAAVSGGTSSASSVLKNIGMLAVVGHSRNLARTWLPRRALVVEAPRSLSAQQQLPRRSAALSSSVLGAQCTRSAEASLSSFLQQQHCQQKLEKAASSFFGIHATRTAPAAAAGITLLRIFLKVRISNATRDPPSSAKGLCSNQVQAPR